MNISEIAIRRPVFTVMVMFALMVLGAMGISRIGTDLFPDVSFPVVTVTVPYPGASPGEVEQLVTKLVEDTVVSLNGIDRIRSYSREGVSQTIIIFKLDVDVKEAAAEVRARVAQKRGRFPDEVKDPIVERLDVGASPILVYSVSGGGRSLADTKKFAVDVIKPALEQVEGVGTVDVSGGANREVHVDLDLAKIDALKLSPTAVLDALRRENLNVPAGHFDEGAREVTVRTVGELSTIEQVRSVIVATSPDGSSVRLSDVARVQDDFESLRTRMRVAGEPAVTFAVVKQSGGNTVAIADGVREQLAKLTPTLPKGVSVDLVIDQSTFIRENTHEVEIAIYFGGAIAILVILIFMLDLRSMLISAIALPTSVVTTFFLMYVFGFTLNMMTLLALSLAIGLLIDDAVVVRENISKHLERGVAPMKAALDGTKEIALSVLATTLTIVAVFLPVAFMPGLVGQFFKQFGITISCAVLVSLFVAFTLDPMLSSRFSKAHIAGAYDRFAIVKKPFLTVFQGIEDFYRVVLRWSVSHRWAVGLLAFGSLVLMFVLAGLTGNDFVNAEDRGQFVVDIEMPAGTKLSQTSSVLAPAEREVLQDKRFVTLLSRLGPDGEVNKVAWRVITVPKHARAVPLTTLREIARRTILKHAPNAKVTITDPPFVEGAGTESPIMVLVRGDKYEELAPLAREFQKAMQRIPGLVDVNVKYSPGQPELRVAVDRDAAARAGVPVAQVALGLRTAIEGQEAGNMRQGKDEVPIVVRLGEGDRATMDDVLRMTIWTPKGAVALRDLAIVERGEGPAAIEREDRSRQIMLTAAPLGRSLGEIVPELDAAFAKIKMPPGSFYKYDGQIRQMNESNGSMGLALGLAVIFIYIVLAAQFESFIHPFTIMLTLPLAFVGAIVALFVSKNSLAMGSMIGIILLMGLVTKNAILLLDRAIVRVREHSESPLQAVLEAGPERLRPILMTSAAMIGGMLPTAISNGEGSEFRAPMAIAVIGGVISSTLLSLVVVPVFYLAIEAAKMRVRRLLGIVERVPDATSVAEPAE